SARRSKSESFIDRDTLHAPISCARSCVAGSCLELLRACSCSCSSRSSRPAGPRGRSTFPPLSRKRSSKRSSKSGSSDKNDDNSKSSSRIIIINNRQASNPSVSFFSYHADGALYAESVPLSDIAARHGTPCYVYSRAALEARYREFA